MYPSIPNINLSWPITQHAGVINKEVITKLLHSCVSHNGLKINYDIINSSIITSGILTNNIRTDSNKADVWRDYQQILSELGLIYSTKITNKQLILTPIATAFLDDTISYEELITLQLLKYQYPNGHKTQLSPSFRKGLPSSINNLSFAEIQASYGIMIRPAVLIFQILVYLFKNNEIASLSVDELQRYTVRCLTNDDAEICAKYIIKSRHEQTFITALPRARRNMQDWIKLLTQSPLFTSADLKNINLSEFAIEHLDECLNTINSLLKPESFWLFSNKSNYKLDWFTFYGNINLGIDWIQLNKVDKNSYTKHTIYNKTNKIHNTDIFTTTSVNLKSYTPTDLPFTPISKKIISEYDYKTSQKGHYLHDSMVDFIARRCNAKGAEVYEDRHTVDLLIRYKSQEFLIEVKSITPFNFINRLRTAIGQINQYDYLIKSNGYRRLGLAFTAEIPDNSWVIPFVTSHLNMDLLTMSNDDLKVNSINPTSIDLFNT